MNSHALPNDVLDIEFPHGVPYCKGKAREAACVEPPLSAPNGKCGREKTEPVCSLYRSQKFSPVRNLYSSSRLTQRHWIPLVPAGLRPT